jgi:hypothetical protein
MPNVNDNFETLAAQVDEAGGIQSVAMEQLREAYEAGRLGTHVRSGISDKLAEHGLHHLPAELPSSQSELVRLYSAGKPIGKVVEAVLNRTEQGDQLLRDVVNADALETLQRVRELVCD